MMTVLENVPAPAKINRFLHITGKRDDGYHLLQSVFTFLDWQDTLHFELRTDGQIIRVNDVKGVPPDQDLIVRAAKKLQQATGCLLGANIVVDKKLPAGGGIGGGSSDAASTLIALNRLWQTGLTRQQLMALALPLGADVPVFIFGQSAFAQGVGEQLDAFLQQKYAYLMLVPQQSIPTMQIFADKGLTRNTKTSIISIFAEHENFASQSDSKQKMQYSKAYANNLQPVALRLYPDLAYQIGNLNHLINECANIQQLNPARWENENGGFDYLRMTGSGSCFFMQFNNLEQAKKCSQLVIAKVQENNRSLPQWIQCIHVCEGINHHPLYNWVTG